MPEWIMFGARVATMAATALIELGEKIADACNPHYIA
jgi:hypothetical protein